MARVLVTGANGHVGANTVRSLLRHGHDVVAFVRPSADLRGLQGLALSYCYGDVMEPSALDGAVEGCDAVIHLAAVYSTHTKDPQAIIQPALAGIRNLLGAARRHAISRVIYTSSIVAVGYSTRPDRLRSESDWNEDAQNPYFVAKTRSEQEARRLAESLGVPMVTLCPAIVLGPYDYRITPSNKMILDLLNGNSPTWEGGYNLIHVSDVAEAHVQALDRGAAGERYIVGGTNLHIRELGQLIRAMTGLRLMHLPLGRRLALPLGTLLGRIAALLGRRPLFDRTLAHEMIERYGYYDLRRTNQTFKLTPRGIEETLRDTIAWLLYLGVVDPGRVRRIGRLFPADPEW